MPFSFTKIILNCFGQKCRESNTTQIQNLENIIFQTQNVSFIALFMKKILPKTYFGFISLLAGLGAGFLVKVECSCLRGPGFDPHERSNF